MKHKRLSLREFKAGYATPGAQARKLDSDPASLLKAFVAEVAAVAQGEDSDGDEVPARTLQFTISTGTIDRDQDTIAVQGWKLENFNRAGVVLWAHDSYSPPLARPVKTWVEGKALKSLAQFHEEFEFADVIYNLYKNGYMKAVSVGFLPIEFKINEERPEGFMGPAVDFLQQELLEFSTVPIPANPEALIEASRKGIGLRPLYDWTEKVLDNGKRLVVPRDSVVALRTALTPLWKPKRAPLRAAVPSPATPTVETRAVPSNVSEELAPEDQEWMAPTLADFTDKPFEELTEDEKRKIAGHFAWAEVMPPESFGQLKLPHHSAEDGKVVWKGVAAAMGALLGARGGVDIPETERKSVYDHLAVHYEAFDKEPPEFSAQPTPEDEAALTLVHEADMLVSNVKRGRVLSRANEDRLKHARDLLDEVLGQLAEPEEDEIEEDSLEVEDDGIEVTEDLLKQLVTEAREQVKTEIERARGVLV